MKASLLGVSGAIVAGVLSACAAGQNNGFTESAATQGAGGGGGTSSAHSGSGGGTNASSSGNFVTSGSGTGGSGGGDENFVAYAHTNKVLFSIDPKAANLGITQIGTFDCIGGSGQDSAMTDLAVNQQGDIWGISYTGIYQLVIQGTTIHCAKTIPLNNASNVQFFGLTFAPAGVLDPTKEVLVAGNTAGELWAIDELGNLSQHGTFGVVPKNDGHGHTYPTANQGKPWQLSGDIVFLANNGSPVGFATVRDCPSTTPQTGCNTTDTLLEIDVSKIKTATTQSVALSVRGQIVKQPGCPDTGNAGGYGSMYGIAAWNAKVYGFSHAGAIVEIDNTDGSACLVQNLAMDFWDGAGVTTLAPVIVPPG
jgi:hypothetical protein